MEYVTVSGKVRLTGNTHTLKYRIDPWASDTVRVRRFREDELVEVATCFTRANALVAILNDVDTLGVDAIDMTTK